MIELTSIPQERNTMTKNFRTSYEDFDTLKEATDYAKIRTEREMSEQSIWQRVFVTEPNIPDVKVTPVV